MINNTGAAPCQVYVHKKNTCFTRIRTQKLKKPEDSCFSMGPPQSREACVLEKDGPEKAYRRSKIGDLAIKQLNG